ncbi:MAG: DUF4168 domain-containing protein [Bacteroidota bacterium]
MSTMKKVAGLFLSVLFLMGGVVHAQQNQDQMMQQQQQQQQKDYSEEEIDVFAEAVAQVLPIQQEAEQKMMKEIEDQGMELDKFNQIARQMQQGGEPEDVSEEDMETFKSISEEIQGIQMETQQEVNKIISDEGMSPAKYQEMISAYSSNPEIKKKVDEKIGDQGQQQQQPQQ